MNVAMVCPYSLSRPGGVQGQALGLARSLAGRGHRVLVLAPDDELSTGTDHPLDDASTGHGRAAVRVIGRPTVLRSNGSQVPLALSPAAALRTLAAVRQFGADVVHLHEPLAPCAGYACLARSAVPLVGTYHRAGGSGWYRAMGPFARWANRRLAVRCAVSVAAMATAKEAMGGEYRVLFNGVATERFARARPWPTEKPTVLFVGRHEERKGLDVLLEAFGRVDAPAELWVAGAGPATEGLRRRFGGDRRVRWLGRVGDAELAERMAGAHVLCAPSLGGESFGVVLLEAMAAGCAVVASDLPGYRECAGGDAELVAPGDPVALAGALARVLADAATGTGRCAPAALDGGRARAASWSIDRLAERYEVLYREAGSLAR
ncbi:MAG: glycosyltransferase family 4 protein [Acidimicrobiales bacterium]